MSQTHFETSLPDFTIRFATKTDLPIILAFIKGLAAYERLADEAVADEKLLAENLFGEHRYAEVLLGFEKEEAVGFALFFHNFSTFLARPGIYLEDLFVKPGFRGRGYGKKLLTALSQIAVERGCGRLEWSVLNWNTSAIEFYDSLKARPMDEWTTYRLDGTQLQKMGTDDLGDVH